METTTDYSRVIAPQHGLAPALVAAMVRVESGGNRFAHRYEWRYSYLWNARSGQPYPVHLRDRSRDHAPADFPASRWGTADTEWVDQQASWGLLQVMGAVAREHGYAGYLPGLCDPMAGLHAGCGYLATLRDRYLNAHGWAGVVAAYNAGHPGTQAGQAYAARVAAAGKVGAVAELVA